MIVADRMARLGTESAFEVLARARALERQGKSVIHLEIGEPDFDTPKHIRQAAIDAMQSGWTHYGPSAGLKDVREAIASYIEKTRGIFVDPARVRRPKDKARVENQVPYVRESWFDGETFADLDDARTGHRRLPRLSQALFDRAVQVALQKQATAVGKAVPRRSHDVAAVGIAQTHQFGCEPLHACTKPARKHTLDETFHGFAPRV